MLAEQAGETRPGGMQRLLSGAHWHAGQVPDDRARLCGRISGRYAGDAVVYETRLQKTTTPSAWRASTPALLGGSRIARSVPSSAMPCSWEGR